MNHDNVWPADREFRCTERGREYSVLDQGYLSVKDRWGSDEGIIESARMSTDKGFLGWEPGACPICDGSGRAREGLGVSPVPGSCHACEGRGTIPGDASLLRHLYEHKHSTPFEFAGLTIEVQAPLMVFREWHRHRTQSYSEMSARYVKMPDIHYVPSVERIIASARKSKNKQASGAGAIQMSDEAIAQLPPEMAALIPRGGSEEDAARVVQALIRTEQKRIYAFYGQLLSFGVAKEIARIDTPVSRYSRMRATGNLRNWLAFLTLRMDPNAQFEIRQFAWCVSDIIATTYPRTHELFFKDMVPLLDPSLNPKRLLKRARSTFESMAWAAATEDWKRDVEPLLGDIDRALGRTG